MISITRELARQLRAVLRKAGAGRNQRPLLELTSGGGELHIRARLPEVTIDFKQPGPFDQETLPVPFEALDDFEGKSNSPITLTRTSEGVDASWDDDKIPKCKSYTVSESAIWPTIPEMDWSKAAEVPGLLQALAYASLCVADVQSRYATNRIQLRGERAEVIATDGRQALIQTGFTFPWKQDLLIPGLALFNCRELPLDLPLTVCKGEAHLAIQVGNVTIYVVIDKEGRFPDVARAVPKPTARATTWRLSPEDAGFLASSLGKLPGRTDNFAPVTVDLHGQVTLRAREDGQKQHTEVVLAGSQVTGTPVRFNTDRHFLARAAALGFANITIIAADQPILCQDATRTYVWVPLDKSLAIPPSEKAMRITTEAKANIPQPTKERMNPPMPTANSNGRSHTSGEHQANANAATTTTAPTDTNGQGNGATEHVENPTASAGTNLGALIAEAHALRDYLHDGYARASRLCVSLKRHRKQSKLVATTLASLRQLQQIDG